MDLWPILESLCDSLDVHQFRSVLPDIKHAVGDHSQNQLAVEKTTQSSKMKLANTNLSGKSKLSGEGICDLLVHIVQFPLTSFTL
jgi:hypothetical protein